jgi:tRNA(adenine34) deaminase
MATHTDEDFLAIAIEEAQACLSAGDPPFGAVLVRDGEVIARGRNLEQSTSDPTAHAETMVLRNAGTSTDTVRFPGTTLYASWEPCPMCLGAMMNAEVARLVLGGRNRPGGGRFGGYTVERLIELASFGDRLSVTTGVLREECEAMVASWRDQQA